MNVFLLAKLVQLSAAKYLHLNYSQMHLMHSNYSQISDAALSRIWAKVERDVTWSFLHNFFQGRISPGQINQIKAGKMIKMFIGSNIGVV